MTTPTIDEHTPADCHFCGKHAIGIGIGFTSQRDKDPKWLCAECGLILEDFKRIKRVDAYELRARQGGMDAAGPLVEEWGADLSEWTEEQVLMFCGRIWDGCAAELRRLVREQAVPF
ncbi:MAG: hypothetical protein EOS04_24380 [Mesorhizobium sp.]|nr:MAG: hypothetical protein EOR98_26720 [Mesorhizobium sp.]RWN73166.1 MAG: hypothetical protein EOS01_26835 [Mesorhizobium sp.]RWN85180.1 MAG: hypothetical protein EOS04_24380 [Mesorhizobium sp.]